MLLFKPPPVKRPPCPHHFPYSRLLKHPPTPVDTPLPSSSRSLAACSSAKPFSKFWPRKPPLSPSHSSTFHSSPPIVLLKLHFFFPFRRSEKKLTICIGCCCLVFQVRALQWCQHAQLLQVCWIYDIDYILLRNSRFLVLR